MSEWRPIETAPKDGTFVLLYVPGERITVKHSDGHTSEAGVSEMYAAGRFFDGLDAWEGWGEPRPDCWVDFATDVLFAPDTPTHWAPLPEPPK